MPDVTFDVNVIWANLILEAFGEYCWEVLLLFWLVGWESSGMGGIGGAEWTVEGCETCGSSCF